MVFNSKNRTEEWLAGIYDGIPDPYTPMMRNYDAYADDFSPSQDWRAFSDWDCIDKILGNWTPQSEWKGNFWSDFPVRIREAYIFLDNVKALPEQEVYQADVDNMKAEARFLIAYYYYLLVNTYGAIPFQTSLVDMNDPIDKILIGQTPYDQIIDWLDKEFKAVSELLPPSYTEERKYGRATSVMALAIRARMLLFAASPLVNGNDDPDYAAYTNNKGEAIFNSTYDPKKWERAVNACKDLLTEAEGNGYALYKEYNGDGSIDPFMSYSNMCYKEFNQGNKEILFARPDVSYDLYSQHSVPRGSRGQGGLGVTQELVDAFFMSNGLPAITGYEPNGEPIINKASGYNESGFSTQPDVRKTKWIEGDKDAKESNTENTIAPAGTFNMYVNREPRFYVSVLYNGAWYRQSSRYVDFYYEGEDGRPASGSLWDAPQTGYLLRKRVHPETNILNYSIPYRPGIICRLAEAYLNYAEALNEWAPEQTDEILKYVNLVRERAGIPQYGTGKDSNGLDKIPAPADQTAMREAIRRERRVEFNCEYAIRFDDIRRWKQIDILRDFIEKKESQQQKGIVENTENSAGLVNGTIETNLGLFRAYMALYLQQHKFINDQLTLMVRTLDPNDNGLPLQLYCFSANKNWVSYESIQAEIFEHYAAIMPRFGLYPFQNPSGRDYINSALLTAGHNPDELWGIPWGTMKEKNTEVPSSAKPEVSATPPPKPIPPIPPK